MYVRLQTLVMIIRETYARVFSFFEIFFFIHRKTLKSIGMRVVRVDVQTRNITHTAKRFFFFF